MLIGAIGCEDKPDIPVVPPAPSGAAAKLDEMLDASAFATDPPAPAGDLKQELDQFTNLDQCVQARAKLDPLVGDALGAIGYDTFLRDACRMLQAAKDRKKETCQQIDSSPLKRKCERWVAIVAQSPDDCPLQYDGLVTRGRTASCVAIAARDPRLCAGEARSAPRATCDAMVARDPAKCAGLSPNQRASCEREVSRWRTLLSASLEGLDKLPVAKGTLTLDSDAGADSKKIDLTSDLANGVVVVTSHDRSRVEIGSLVESELARIAAGPQRAARIGLAVMMDPAPSLQKLELVLPGEAPVVSPPAKCDCKLSGLKMTAKRGSEVSFSLDGKLVTATSTLPISVNVTTWVRDIVTDNDGALRVIPPTHPSTFRRDGG